MTTENDHTWILWCTIEAALKLLLWLLVAWLTVRMYLKCTLGMCESLEKMDGKTVIITGGNSGVGKETARDLARRNARVILACRNLKKAQQVADEIFRETNQRVVIKHLDLASFKSVREFAKDINQSESRLDVLINNAGIVNYTDKKVTEDGYELCFQSNYLGHFLLTLLLTGLLKKTAPSRVVNVSSSLHLFGSVSRIKEHALGTNPPRHPFVNYFDTKKAQVIFTRYLADKLKRFQVTVNAVHPGLTSTNILDVREGFAAGYFKVYFYLFGKTSEEGAQTSIYAAVAPELQEKAGHLFAECGKRSFDWTSRNHEVEEELFKTSCSMAGLTDAELQECFQKGADFRGR